MPVLKPRNRLVYFRVSEDEFREFSEMCDAAKARSLSDLARNAMQEMRTRRSGDELIKERLKSVDELISRVNEKLELMGELLETNTKNGRKQEPAE